MSKFSLKIFQKGKPVYWIVGAIAVFVVFYFLFSRQSSGSTSTGVTAVSSGPSDALQASLAQTNAQVAIAQGQVNLGAQQSANDLAAAGLAAQVALAQTAAGADVSKLGIEHDATIALANIDANKQIAALNASYSLESARVASETALAAKGIDANLLITQLNINNEMYKTQSQTLIEQSLIAQIPTLRKGDRDDITLALAGAIQGQTIQPHSYYEGGSSGGGLGNLLGSAIGVLPALL